MEKVASRIKDGDEKEEIPQEDGEHHIKDSFSVKSVRKTRKNECKDDSAGKHHPNFYERNHFGTGRFGGYDEGIFHNSENVVIEGHEEKDEEHWDELFELIILYWPEGSAPATEGRL
jgi:hypothetical protein